MKNGSNTLPYTLTFNTFPVTDASTPIGLTPATLNCGDDESQSLVATVTRTNINAVVAGNYSDTLTLTVSPL
jgi:spore coat protein U-like protein